MISLLNGLQLNISIQSDNYDFRSFNNTVENTTVVRVEKLINEAIGRINEKKQYSLFDKNYNYGWGEGYSLDILLADGVCMISGVERDIKYPFSIFPAGRIFDAARYFVWLVSEGRVQIDSTLFLD